MKFGESLSSSRCDACKFVAPSLASSLCQAEEWADELSRDLAEKEEDLRRLRELSQSQSSQIQQLRGVCAQLGAAAEMNEVG